MVSRKLIKDLFNDKKEYRPQEQTNAKNAQKCLLMKRLEE